MVICRNCGRQFPELTKESLEGLPPCPGCRSCTLEAFEVLQGPEEMEEDHSAHLGPGFFGSFQDAGLQFAGFAEEKLRTRIEARREELGATRAVFVEGPTRSGGSDGGGTDGAIGRARAKVLFLRGPL